MNNFQSADFTFQGDPLAKVTGRSRRISASRKPKTAPWPGAPGFDTKPAVPAAPAWEATFDKSGKLVSLKQLRPLPRSEDLKFENLSRRFKVIVEGDAIVVGGFHCDHGTKIECHYHTAINIYGGGRGRIIEEFTA